MILDSEPQIKAGAQPVIPTDEMLSGCERPGAMVHASLPAIYDHFARRVLADCRAGLRTSESVTNGGKPARVVSMSADRVDPPWSQGVTEKGPEA